MLTIINTALSLKNSFAGVGRPSLNWSIVSKSNLKTKNAAFGSNYRVHSNFKSERKKRTQRERERRVDQKIKIKPGNIDLECKRYEEKESETKR